MLTRRQSSTKRTGETAASEAFNQYGNVAENRSQMGPIYEGFLHVFRGRFLAKWKRFMGAVFDENSTGHARLELYASDKQLSTINPAKTVLLSECIAIRIVTFKKNERVIQIQQRTEPVMLITVEDIDKWHGILCKVAFPNQFVAIGSQPCSSVSPCSSGEYAVPADVRRIPVMLQRISGTARPQLAEGNYDMYLNHSLVISNAMHSVTWEYLMITWFAIGFNCFAFEVTKEGRYEFSSSQPMALLHAFRCHTSLTNIDNPPRFITKNHYDHYYIPSSIINDSPVLNSRAQAAQPKHRDIPCSHTDSGLPIATGYETRVEQINKEWTRSPRLPLFHRHSNSNWHERADFETNADDEWIRMDSEEVNRNAGREKSQNEVHISRPMEFELIAANEVLQLAQLDDTPALPIPSKTITEVRIARNEHELRRSNFSGHAPFNRLSFPPEAIYAALQSEPPPAPPRASQLW